MAANKPGKLDEAEPHIKTLIILGSDSASSWLGHRLEREKFSDVLVYRDSSGGLGRVLKLLRSRRLALSAFFSLATAEFLRTRATFSAHGDVSSNAELSALIAQFQPEQVLCFRCGLVISQMIIGTGVPIYNIHVSDLPEFPGLGTVWKSIKARAWSQSVCLHQIDEGIDTGQILHKKSYIMSPQNSYRVNEDIAYQAGIELAVEFLSRE